MQAAEGMGVPPSMSLPPDPTPAASKRTRNTLKKRAAEQLAAAAAAQEQGAPPPNVKPTTEAEFKKYWKKVVNTGETFARAFPGTQVVVVVLEPTYHPTGHAHNCTPESNSLYQAIWSNEDVRRARATALAPTQRGQLTPSPLELWPADELEHCTFRYLWLEAKRTNALAVWTPVRSRRWGCGKENWKPEFWPESISWDAKTLPGKLKTKTTHMAIVRAALQKYTRAELMEGMQEVTLPKMQETQEAYQNAFANAPPEALPAVSQEAIAQQAAQQQNFLQPANVPLVPVAALGMQGPVHFSAPVAGDGISGLQPAVLTGGEAPGGPNPNPNGGSNLNPNGGPNLNTDGALVRAAATAMGMAQELAVGALLLPGGAQAHGVAPLPAAAHASDAQQQQQPQQQQQAQQQQQQQLAMHSLPWDSQPAQPAPAAHSADSGEQGIASAAQAPVASSQGDASQGSASAAPAPVAMSYADAPQMMPVAANQVPVSANQGDVSLPPVAGQTAMSAPPAPPVALPDATAAPPLMPAGESQEHQVPVGESQEHQLPPRPDAPVGESPEQGQLRDASDAPAQSQSGQQPHLPGFTAAAASRAAPLSHVSSKRDQQQMSAPVVAGGDGDNPAKRKRRDAAKTR